MQFISFITFRNNKTKLRSLCSFFIISGLTYKHFQILPLLQLGKELLGQGNGGAFTPLPKCIDKLIFQPSLGYNSVPAFQISPQADSGGERCENNMECSVLQMVLQ